MAYATGRIGTGGTFPRKHAPSLLAERGCLVKTGRRSIC